MHAGKVHVRADMQAGMHAGCMHACTPGHKHANLREHAHSRVPSLPNLPTALFLLSLALFKVTPRFGGRRDLG